MRFVFETENLNQRLYKRAIRVFLYETLKRADVRWVRILDDLTITIRPSTKSSENPFFHGQNGVGGVTGINTVLLYLEDVKTPIDDNFLRVFRRNMIATSHELCHHILIQLGFNHRVALKHDDFSGHKAGTRLNASTALVHDRHTERRFFFKKFWFWDWSLLIPRRLTMQCLDIRDLV